MNRKGASGQIWQVHCFKIEATHEINVFVSVFRQIRDHIWQKLSLSFINICNILIRTFIKLATFYEKLQKGSFQKLLRVFCRLRGYADLLGPRIWSCFYSSVFPQFLYNKVIFACDLRFSGYFQQPLGKHFHRKCQYRAQKRLTFDREGMCNCVCVCQKLFELP